MRILARRIMSSNAMSSISSHAKLMLSEHPMKVLFRLSLPIYCAYLMYYLRDIVSVYYQTVLFGDDGVLLQAVQQPLIAIFGQAMPNALMLYYVIEGTQLMADNNLELLRTTYAILMLNLGLTSGLFLVIIVFTIKALTRKFYVASRFEPTMIAQVFLAYLFSALNETNQLKFIAENRRILALSYAVVTCLIQMALEALLYLSYDANQGFIPQNNWPTIVSNTVAGVVVSAWLMLLFKNYTALGIINKNPFTISIKEVFNFNNSNLKIYLKYISYSLPKLVSLVSAPMTILLCISQIYKRFKNAYDEYSAINDLFSYWHIGQVCRIASYSFSECTIFPLQLCYKKRQWRRVNYVMWASLLMCVIENLVIGILFYFIPLQRVFIGASDYQTYYYENGNSQQVIIISCLAGSMNIFPELAILVSNLEGNYVLPMLLSVCKIIMGTLAAFLLGKTNGDRANFMIAISFMELSNCFLGLILVVIYSVKFMLKYSALDKAQKAVKKLQPRVVK